MLIPKIDLAIEIVISNFEKYVKGNDYFKLNNYLTLLIRNNTTLSLEPHVSITT
jgi:hypothetical protein